MRVFQHTEKEIKRFIDLVSGKNRAPEKTQPAQYENTVTPEKTRPAQKSGNGK